MKIFKNFSNPIKRDNGQDKSPGLFHYKRQKVGEQSRIHLRVDSDGTGLLLVNANKVIHLNPTAAYMARLSLEETPEDQAISKIRKTYKVSKEIAKSDYLDFQNQIDELTRPDGVCPIHNLEIEIKPPFDVEPSAPYRMDLAITYRCNNDCPHCYNARPRNYKELDTQSWRDILDKLWDYGIPHIVFTGGEPTIRADLCELIAHAEKNGQITGINTNGRRLKDSNFVKQLVDAGLDHVQITFESHEPYIHDEMVAARGAWKQTVSGLNNVLESPLFVMTNTTMLNANSPFLAETIEFLANMGVPTIGLNALIYSGKGKNVGTGIKESELSPLLETARHLTQKFNQRLIWYTPTQYCNFDPMQLELGVKGCTAALYNMCIEPDGGVLPCQSYYVQLGNLLIDDWDSIWNHNLALSLRERRNIPDKCRTCVLLSECGGGCPLYFQHVNDLSRHEESTDNLQQSL
jgi:radical SAM protein with 4Fe4S-binding SPASM domain